jgi:hypothetical protein
VLRTYWKVEMPQEGMTFMLVSVHEGIPSTAINAAAPASGWMAANQWNQRADALMLMVTALPAEMLTRLRLTISPVILQPDTGN